MLDIPEIDPAVLESFAEHADHLVNSVKVFTGAIRSMADNLADITQPLMVKMRRIDMYLYYHDKITEKFLCVYEHPKLYKWVCNLLVWVCIHLPEKWIMDYDMGSNDLSEQVAENTCPNSND